MVTVKTSINVRGIPQVPHTDMLTCGENAKHADPGEPADPTKCLNARQAESDNGGNSYEDRGTCAV